MSPSLFRGVLLSLGVYIAYSDGVVVRNKLMWYSPGWNEVSFSAACSNSVVQTDLSQRPSPMELHLKVLWKKRKKREGNPLLPVRFPLPQLLIPLLREMRKNKY